SPPAGANDCAGPNGVVATFPWLFVTDAGSRVVTIDLRNGATVADIVTRAGEPTRADELAYNQRDALLLVINNASTPPVWHLDQGGSDDRRSHRCEEHHPGCGPWC